MPKRISSKKAAAQRYELTCKGKYRDVIASLDLCIAKQPSDDLLYRERAHFHLFLGEAQKARADFDVADQLRHRGTRTAPGRLWSDLEYGMIGLTYWMEGHREIAHGFWRYVVESLHNGRVGYAPTGGGIESGLMLWFAAVYLKREHDVELVKSFYEARRRSTFWSHNLDGWPGPIVQFFLKEIDEDQLLGAAESAQDRCEAHVAAAIRMRESRRYAAAAKHLKAASPDISGAAIIDEYYNCPAYYLARFESRRPTR